VSRVAAPSKSTVASMAITNATMPGGSRVRTGQARPKPAIRDGTDACEETISIHAKPSNSMPGGHTPSARG
jgi:hypothetical protein